MQQTFSATEIEAAKADGWVLVKETVIAGKVRSALMAKGGNAYAWIEADAAAKRAEYRALSKTEKRLHMDRHKRYARGLD